MNRQTLGLTIGLAPLFIKYLDPAVVHLRVHYPALVFSGANCGIAVARGLKVNGSTTPQTLDALTIVARQQRLYQSVRFRFLNTMQVCF